jgi:capsular polysaccharide biosynthesis protein
VRIDPSRAWAILPGGKLFWKSIPFSEVDLPPRPWFTKYSFLKKKVTRVPALISSRYWIHNYFHFYNDFLGSLELLERKNIPLEIPIIVPKFIFDGPLFKSIQTRSRHLKKRPLLIQSPSEYFETEYALFPKVMPNRRLLFDWVLDDLGVTIPTVSANKKIYIIRSAAATRGIKNAKEIETIAASEGFTCVETGKLTANEQEKLFAEATHVVAVHGAGLLNIIFRRAQPMSVLEIFPEGFIPPHYYWLSKEYGYRYEALVAGAEIKGNFHLDPTTFRKALKNLIGTASAI